MRKLVFILKYFRYYFKAQTKHDVHSPFVYDLITKVIEDKTVYSDYKSVKELKRELLKSDLEITVADFGAGSTSLKTDKRIVGDIVKTSAKSAKYGQLLYRLVKRFEPINMLELGTSLGISATYISLPNSQNKLITIEGSEMLANLARQNFEKINLKNIDVVSGNFDDQLPKVLKRTNQLNFVFFDGNHRKEATLNYFNQCIPFINNDSLFVFDDIHWSDEMEEAWEEIKKHPSVKVTIDLFFIGLVFFRKEQPKQNFTIRY